MKKLIMWCCIFCLIASGCSSGTQKSRTLVGGTWKGTSPDGTELVMTFRDDMTVVMETKIWSETQEILDITSTAKYQVDYIAVPITLDIFDIRDNHPGTAGVSRYVGIVRFIDGDTMQMCGSPEWDGHPADFNESTIELTRK